MDHILHCHRKRILISENHIAKGITNKNTVDPCLILQLCRGVIVCGKHCDLDSVLFCLSPCLYCVFHLITNLSEYPLSSWIVAFPVTAHTFCATGNDVCSVPFYGQISSACECFNLFPLQTDLLQSANALICSLFKQISSACECFNPHSPQTASGSGYSPCPDCAARQALPWCCQGSDRFFPPCCPPTPADASRPSAHHRAPPVPSKH